MNERKYNLGELRDKEHSWKHVFKAKPVKPIEPVADPVVDVKWYYGFLRYDITPMNSFSTATTV